MEYREPLESMELSVEKGIFRINGKDMLLPNTIRLDVVCEAGMVRINVEQSFSGRLKKD